MEHVKKIGTFSCDAVAQCMQRVFTPEEKQQYIELTKKLSCELGESVKDVVTKKSRKVSTIPSSEETFTNHILPQIRNCLERYEMNLVSNRQIMLSEDIIEGHDYSTLSMENVKAVHENLCKQEEVAGTRYLLAKFFRGNFYLFVYQQILNEPDIKKWFTEKLNISYSTAQRYMTFASLIRRYPRLLVCDLTFEQMLYHRENLANYLAKECEGVKEKLSITAEFLAPHSIEVNSSEMQIPGNCLI